MNFKRDLSCLTEVEFKLIDFIYNFKLREERDPFHREIANGIGVAKTKTILSIIKLVVAKNILVYNSRKGGTIDNNKFCFLVDYKSIPLCSKIH